MSVDAFTCQRRREAKRETRRNASASLVIPFPPASRGERKVKTAASDFINAILNVSAGLVAADEHAAILSARIGRYQAPTFIASFDPPAGRGPDNLFSRGDRSGRVVVIWQDERGEAGSALRAVRPYSAFRAPSRRGPPQFAQDGSAMPQLSSDCARCGHEAHAARRWRGHPTNRPVA
jgi:hypothetical protein